MASLTRTSGQAVLLRADRIRITRVGVFSVFSLVVGLLLLFNVPMNYDTATTTTLTFGEASVPDIPVPVVGFSMSTGVIFIIGGVLGLLPQLPTWLKSSGLILNGVLFIPVLLVITAAGSGTNITTMLASSFRLATPIIIGALAGLWCERTGVVNIAIEGMMLTGACIGFIGNVLLAPIIGGQNALAIGVVLAMLAGGVMALLHAHLSIRYMIDQVVSGTVINILAIGLTSFLRREILLSSEAARETLRVIKIPLLADIPVIGQVLFTGKPIFLSMFILIALTHIVIYFTRWGLRTRAVGENPKAADTLGINVYRIRYINVVMGGMIAGLAGAWLSLETVGQFDDNMTGGLGFIALAAMIFGKWTPLGAAAGGLLFGFAQALNTRFQILEVPIPPQFIQMTPYLITMIVLAGLVGKATAPKADGVPYKKE